jgi:hypothetical protein
LQAAAVFLFHHADAGACGNDVQGLLRKIVNYLGHPVGRVAGIVLQPLAKHGGDTRSHAVSIGARPQAPDHAKPRGDRLAQERAFTADQRLLVQRDPEIRGIALQHFAKEARRSDANDGERMALDGEGAAHDGRIGAIDGLPDTVADDGDRRRGWLVIARSKDTAAESGNSQRGKITAADVFRTQRSGGGLDTLTPHAEASAAGLEGGDFLEFRSG